jgi:hypothetical protein
MSAVCQFVRKKWKELISSMVMRGGHMKTDKVCELAASLGNVEVFSKLYNYGFPVNKVNCVVAACNYNYFIGTPSLEMLRFLYKVGLFLTIPEKNIVEWMHEIIDGNVLGDVDYFTFFNAYYINGGRFAVFFI